MKSTFIIVGSGWRAMYYVRVAKSLPEMFELKAVLCRSQEKAERIRREMEVDTSTSIEECVGMEPDFVVVAVDKASIAAVSREWMERGFTVLCETPAGLNLEDLQELWRLHKDKKNRLCVAEQYFHYPSYSAVLSVLAMRLIGDPYSVDISLAHDYHGASLIRKFLKIKMEPFTVTGRRYSEEVAETATRYERIRDGRTAMKNHDRIAFTFEGGKTAFYDFCGEQYRSEIRGNYLRIQGVRGEFQGFTGTGRNSLGWRYKDDYLGEVHYLDEENEPQFETMKMETSYFCTDDTNPNLQEVSEVKQIKLGRKVLYRPYSWFGLCGLTEDETAVAASMLATAMYDLGGKDVYPLREALEDAYMSILTQKALENPGECIHSERQPWEVEEEPEEEYVKEEQVTGEWKLVIDQLAGNQMPEEDPEEPEETPTE